MSLDIVTPSDVSDSAPMERWAGLDLNKQGHVLPMAEKMFAVAAADASTEESVLEVGVLDMKNVRIIWLQAEAQE